MNALYIVGGVVALILGMSVISAYVSRKRGEATADKKNLEEEAKAHEQFEKDGEDWDRADPMGAAARGMPDDRSG